MLPASFALVEDGTTDEFPVQASYTEFNVATVTPTGVLKPEPTYHLTLKTSLTTTLGDPLEETTLSFTTEPNPFNVVSVQSDGSFYTDLLASTLSTRSR